MGESTSIEMENWKWRIEDGKWRMRLCARVSKEGVWGCGLLF